MRLAAGEGGCAQWSGLWGDAACKCGLGEAIDGGAEAGVAEVGVGVDLGGLDAFVAE